MGGLFYFCRSLETQHQSILLTTAYLPPAIFFWYLLKYDGILIEQYETYPKQSYRNRCEIMTANGKLSLTIPVSKPQGNQTITKDIVIANTERWQQNHWRAITSAYLNSPFFEFYRDDFEEFFSKKAENLLQFNQQIIDRVCKIVGIKTKTGLSKNYEHSPHNKLDLRKIIHPKKIIDVELFPEYIQVFSAKFDFIPNLSIIDLLFNLGPETLDYLKSIELKPNKN